MSSPLFLACRSLRRKSRTSPRTPAEAGKERSTSGVRDGPGICFNSQSRCRPSIRASSPGRAPRPKRFAAIAVSMFTPLFNTPGWKPGRAASHCPAILPPAAQALCKEWSGESSRRNQDLHYNARRGLRLTRHGRKNGVEPIFPAKQSAKLRVFTGKSVRPHFCPLQIQGPS